MDLLWFEIKFSEVDLSRGKDTDLINETKKLYKILNEMDGVALFAGKHRKSIGQRYYLSIPDNQVGKNLLQYLKLKKYKQGVQPDLDELKYIYGSYKDIKEETDYSAIETLDLNQN